MSTECRYFHLSLRDSLFRKIYSNMKRNFVVDCDTNSAVDCVAIVDFDAFVLDF